MGYSILTSQLNPVLIIRCHWLDCAEPHYVEIRVGFVRLGMDSTYKVQATKLNYEVLKKSQLLFWSLKIIISKYLIGNLTWQQYRKSRRFVELFWCQIDPHLPSIDILTQAKTFGHNSNFNIHFELLDIYTKWELLN